MATDKAYVHVDDFAINESFDRKHKTSSSLKKAMKAAAVKAINKSSKLTTKPINDKDKGKDDAKKPMQFYVGGGVSKITKYSKGKKEFLKAEMKIQTASWPKKSMFGFADGNRAFVDYNAKRIDKEVEELLSELVDVLMTKDVVKALEARVPDSKK